MKIVRSDRLRINANTPGQYEALAGTVKLYRRLVRDLMTVVFTEWPGIGHLSGNEVVKAVEALIHPTERRPAVKYPYFARRYHKFPSYLRRVAIMDACGQVRSFMTRYGRWQSGDRKRPDARTPKLTCATNTWPSMYQGQCVRFAADMRSCWIKVFHQGDWIWMAFRLSGETRYIGNGKKLSPSLVGDKNGWELSVPVEQRIDLPDRVDRVLAIDVGVKTAATWAVVDTTGTVHARGFLRRSDKDRESRLMARIRTAAKKHTRHGCRLPRGFKAADHRRLTNLADDQAHQLSRRLADLAVHHGCDAVVVERLKGWRPRGGKKRTTMRQRYHRWFHRMLVTRTCDKAHEAGLRTVSVYPRGTSSYAFDGSGKIRRDKTNASLCTFPTGKRYNADLNAAYNIAARGLLQADRHAHEGGAGTSRRKSGRTPGSPVTLSSLRTESVRQAA